MSSDLVPIRKSGATQVNLLDLQEKVALRQIAETRTSVSSRKGRVEEAKRVFALDPTVTMVEIQDRAKALADTVDPTITVETLPLTQEQINRLSDEFFQLEKLKVQIEALAERYRPIIFGHLDMTVARVPGRPASQTPGVVEATGPGPHYKFERRGGGREAPDLDTEGMRKALERLSPELVAEVYQTVHHDAVAAWDEDVFNVARFDELAEQGLIDLDVVAKHLTPGKFRTPSFNKTLVDGD